MTSVLLVRVLLRNKGCRFRCIRLCSTTSSSKEPKAVTKQHPNRPTTSDYIKPKGTIQPPTTSDYIEPKGTIHHPNNQTTSDCIEPKDTIPPPKRLWRYVVNKFTNLVDKYEMKLEKKSPKAFQVYKTIKCIRYIVTDSHTYVTVASALWAGRELHTFTRQELEVYQEMPQEMFKIIALLVTASLPFVGNFLVMIGYWFPRTLFTHHLWNEEQKAEFGQYFHTKRITHYHQVLDHMDKQARRITEGDDKKAIMNILDQIEHSRHPTAEQLLALKPQFESSPYGLDELSTRYYRLLAQVNKLSVRSRRRLQQDGLILLHIDRAMVREGFDTLSHQDMCKACLKRGLNPYGMSEAERIQFLQKWTQISQHLDERNVSLLLHCPALLSYNAPTNIQLMKGKKYHWKRSSTV